MKMQVTDVNTVLASVGRMTDKGNRVVLEKGGGYIENAKTGRRIQLQRKNNVYVFEMLVKVPWAEEEGGKKERTGEKKKGMEEDDMDVEGEEEWSMVKNKKKTGKEMKVRQ